MGFADGARLDSQTVLKNRAQINLCPISYLVRGEGVEPSQVAPLPPQSSVSAIPPPARRSL